MYGFNVNMIELVEDDMMEMIDDRMVVVGMIELVYYDMIELCEDDRLY